MSSHLEQASLYAYNDPGTSSNDNSSVTTLPARSQSISAGLIDKSKRIELKTDCQYLTSIFVAIAHAQTTDDWKNTALITRKTSTRFIARIFDWLQNNRAYPQSPATVLNDYVASFLDQDDDRARRLAGSGIYVALRALRLGSSSPLLSPSAKQYIARTIKQTRTVSDGRSHPCLGAYLSLPQVRETIGQNDFLKLASPKILHASFVATISAMLELIQETRAIVAALQSANSMLSTDRCSSYYRVHVHGVRMINHLYFGDHEGSKIVKAAHKAIILHGFLRPDKVQRLKTTLQRKGAEPLINSVCHAEYSVDGLQLICARSSLAYGERTCAAEEILVQYLCASLTVQPSDIGKLRVRDFVVSKSLTGVAEAIRCSYYKGRSGAMRSTRDVSKGEPLFSPLLAYLDGRDAAERLFS